MALVLHPPPPLRVRVEEGGGHRDAEANFVGRVDIGHRIGAPSWFWLVELEAAALW